MALSARVVQGYVMYLQAPCMHCSSQQPAAASTETSVLYSPLHASRRVASRRPPTQPHLQSLASLVLLPQKLPTSVALPDLPFALPKMIRTQQAPVLKKRLTVDPKKRQFADATWSEATYNHALNFYALPPTANITLEEFEQWAIMRLKVLGELETCTFRNKTPEETLSYMTPILEKHLPLLPNSSKSPLLLQQRKWDHYSHFILRLAFSSTADLRQRFSRLETQLFRLRYRILDSQAERRAFIDSLDLRWAVVDDNERSELHDQLRATPGAPRKADDQGWFKVDWDMVPDMVEQRRCLVTRGMAYVPIKEQLSLLVAEFTSNLDQALEVRSPRGPAAQPPSSTPRLLDVRTRPAPCPNSTKTTVSPPFSPTCPMPLPPLRLHTTTHSLARSIPPPPR